MGNMHRYMGPVSYENIMTPEKRLWNVDLLNYFNHIGTAGLLMDVDVS